MVWYQTQFEVKELGGGGCREERRGEERRGEERRREERS